MTSSDPRDPGDFSLEELFCLEVGEQCALLTDSLPAALADVSVASSFDPLIRAGHTIKGGARVVGRLGTARIAHALEVVLLAAQRDRALSPDTASAVLRSVELLIRITAVDAAEAARLEQENAEEIEAVVATLQSVGGPSAAHGLPPIPFPLSVPAHDPKARPGEQPRGRAGKLERGGMRVLVVEDSPTVRETERSLVEGYGYNVDTAVDGAEGWVALQTSPYDLVVTDVEMPNLNGIELLRRIRSDERLRRIPVVIVSQKETEADQRLGLEAGANNYLTKGSLQDESFLRVVGALMESMRS